jgi:flagellar hook-associated protein 2
MRRLGEDSSVPFTPLVFTGISSYSADFNTVLKRAVAIASLPLQKLQNDDADILSKKTLLGGLTASVASFAASVEELGTVASNRAIVATSSNSAKVSAVYAGATSSASYTISDITSVAAAASETTLTGYADTTTAPVSSVNKVKLVIGTDEYVIDLTGKNNLAGLRDAINDLDAGVTASLITSGTGPTPNHLALTADSFGETTLRLFDDPLGTPVNLVTNTNQGSNVEFKLNGIAVSRTSNVVSDVVGGLTFTILDTTGVNETITLSLATSRGQLQAAIQSFANEYNSLVNELGKHIGPAADLLSGEFLVRDVQSSLRLLTSYAGTGSIESLADLGVTLGQDGKITFDTTVFTALSDNQISSAFDFFGAAGAGFAGLAEKFTQVSDPITGLAKLQQDSYDAADRRIQDDIETLNQRIADLQASVSARLQAADALLAQLDSQQNILLASIEALNTVTFGKRSE